MYICMYVYIYIMSVCIYYIIYLILLHCYYQKALTNRPTDMAAHSSTTCHINVRDWCTTVSFAHPSACMQAKHGRRIDVLCLCVLDTTLSACSARNDLDAFNC